MLRRTSLVIQLEVKTNWSRIPEKTPQFAVGTSRYWIKEKRVDEHGLTDAQ